MALFTLGVGRGAEVQNLARSRRNGRPGEITGPLYRVGYSKYSQIAWMGGTDIKKRRRQKRVEGRVVGLTHCVVQALNRTVSTNSVRFIVVLRLKSRLK